MVISCRTATLKNNSQCLLLNILINATWDIFQKCEIKKKIWKKSKKKKVSSSNIYKASCICNSVLSSIKTCRRKLNGMLSFSSFIWILFSRSFVPRFHLLPFRVDIKATTGGVLYKKPFLKYSQHSQENTCIGVTFY